MRSHKSGLPNALWTIRVDEQTVFQAIYSAPAPVIEYVTPSLVVEFIAPAPAVTHVTSSEQFSPSPQETAEVVQIGFVHPPGSMTVVEPFASHVVGSLPLFDEFATSVPQEQITSEQIVHPQTRELIVEGVVEILQERLPEGIEEQSEDSPVSVTHVTPEQSSPVHAMTAVANDASLDSTDRTSECALAPVIESVVYPCFSTPSVEAETPKVDVPIPQIQEQIIEGIKDISKERFSEQTLEQIVDEPILPIMEGTAGVMLPSHTAVHATPTLVSENVELTTIHSQAHCRACCCWP